MSLKNGEFILKISIPKLEYFNTFSTSIKDEFLTS